MEPTRLCDRYIHDVACRIRGIIMVIPENRRQMAITCQQLL